MPHTREFATPHRCLWSGLVGCAMAISAPASAFGWSPSFLLRVFVSARAMGHASATDTLGTYAHLWPTVEDKTRAAASEMAATVLATSLPQVDTQ